MPILLPASDGTAPFAIHTFNQITGGNTIYPRQAAVVNDHFVFTGKDSDDRQTSIGRAFAGQQEMSKPYYATPGDGIFHFYFPEQGLVLPGQFIAGSRLPQPRVRGLRRHWHRCRLDHARFRLVHRLCLLHGRQGATGRFRRPTTALDERQRHRPALLERWGAKQSQGMSVEFVDRDMQLHIAYRNTISNMMAEGEAQNGIFAPDELTYAWYREKGMDSLPYPAIRPGKEANYEIDETFDLSGVEPMIAKPFSPANAFPAAEVAKEKIEFDKAYIGSCTNGSYQDLMQAALVLRAAREGGRNEAKRDFIVFPGSIGVKQNIENPEPRLGGESIAEVFRSVGGKIRESWCGPCFGQGPDALKSGERAITTFNRNWQNRMGLGGEGFLASPAVVAASALLGYMAPPSELGLDWDPKEFGI